MSISTRRLLLLSSSALVALCFTGAASSQTPPTPSETPPAATPPASETPAPQAPQTTPEAPAGDAANRRQTTPRVTVPTVTVTAPPRPRTRTARPAAPARVTTLRRLRNSDANSDGNTERDHRESAGGDVAVQSASGFIEHHHQQSDPSEPGPELRQPVLHSARRDVGRSCAWRVAPGAARARRFPRPGAGERHRLDGRLRSRPGSRRADRSALDPEDRDLPRSGGAALRLAGGGRRRRGHQQPHSLRRAGGRLASPDHGRHHDGRPRSRGRRLVRCRHPRFRHACRLLRPTCQRLFRSELPLSFSRPTPRRRSTASSRTRACIPRDRRWAAPICSTAVMWARRSRASPASIGFPRSMAPRPTPASTWRRPRSPARASFVRNPPRSTSCASGWARSNTNTTSWVLMTTDLIPRARPLTTTPRKPRPKSSSCRWSRHSAP